MSILKRIAPLCIGAVLLLAPDSLANAVSKETTPEVIELRISGDGLFVFDVQINDGRTIPAILDTAAAISGIRKETLEELNINHRSDEMIIHGLLASESSETTTIKNISAGSIAHAGQVVVLPDMGSIHDPAVKALIGTDFLSSNSQNNRYLFVNFVHKKMELLNRLSRLPSRKFHKRLQWTDLTQYGEEQNFLTFPVKISGVKATAILDTGINFTVINKALSNALEKRGKKTAHHEYTDVNGEKAVLSHINMGKVRTSHLSWSASRAVIKDAPALERLGLGQKPAVLLGLNHVKNMAFIVDRQKNRIAFVTPNDINTKGQTITCTGSRTGCGGSFVTNYTY